MLPKMRLILRSEHRSTAGCKNQIRRADEATQEFGFSLPESFFALELKDRLNRYTATTFQFTVSI